jgi:hypothetical protein
MKHEFHFILNQKHYFNLLDLSKSLNKNISKTLVFILENLNPFIEKNHLASIEKGSKYQTLALPEEKRFHIHCYLNENLYRRLKHLHHDLNTYSLAQIMRRLIDSFLLGCFKYGIKDFRERLLKIKKIWEKKKNIYRKEKVIFLRHVSFKPNNKPYCLTSYDDGYRPFQIQLL